MDRTRLAGAVIDWYDRHARDLPWRSADASPWAVMVSEFMLQQTPVARVLVPWREWLERWPTPSALAAEPVGEAVRAWGRLGYPRRAQRLHAAAVTIVERHGGEVPSDPDALRALPGVGDYTAAAIASFAFGVPQVVLDVNVRRVLARLDAGTDTPLGSPTVAERRLARAWLPEGGDAVRWSVAAMELGAQVCRASNPDCASCPVRTDCRWRAAGRPAGAPRPRQLYAGTDRAARGHVLQRLRDRAPGAVLPAPDLVDGWPDAAQADRALRSLVVDGLITATGDGYRL